MRRKKNISQKMATEVPNHPPRENNMEKSMESIDVSGVQIFFVRNTDIITIVHICNYTIKLTIKYPWDSEIHKHNKTPSTLQKVSNFGWYHAECQASWMNNGFWKRCAYGIFAVFVYLPVCRLQLFLHLSKEHRYPQHLSGLVTRNLPTGLISWWCSHMFPMVSLFQIKNPQTPVSHGPPL